MRETPVTWGNSGQVGNDDSPIRWWFIRVWYWTLIFLTSDNCQYHTHLLFFTIQFTWDRENKMQRKRIPLLPNNLYYYYYHQSHLSQTNNLTVLYLLSQTILTRLIHHKNNNAHFWTQCEECTFVNILHTVQK